MSETPALESNTVTLKLELKKPRITITYKDKHDLFETFKKKCEELGIPHDVFIWINEDREPVRVSNADILVKIADQSASVHLYAGDDNDEGDTCYSCDERAGCKNLWNLYASRRWRGYDRSRSRDPRGPRPRSRECPRSHDHSGERHGHHSRRHHGHGPSPGFGFFDEPFYLQMMDPYFEHCPPFRRCRCWLPPYY